MKNIKFSIVLFLSLAILFFVFPRVAFAADDSNDVVKTNSDGSQCIDLEAAYAQINNESKAYTNVDNGIDATKKANMLALLSNISSLLLGNSIYCVKDEIAASKMGGLKQYGLLGEISIANGTMMASYPTISVSEHLAQMFVPGYGSNSSTYAADVTDCTSATSAYNSCIDENKCNSFSGTTKSNCELKCSPQLYTMTELCGTTTTTTSQDLNSDQAKSDGLNAIGNAASQLGIDSSTLNSITGVDVSSVEEDDNTMSTEAVTYNGYAYLKDTLHLDTIWNFSRNLAYLGYIVITIAIGFMIMFRKKLGGQLVVSLGNAIPNLVIGLILVTFSFAIVGIMLDLGKIGINVAQSMFTEIAQETNSSSTNAAGLASGEVIKTDNVGSLFNAAFTSSTGEGSKIAASLAAVPVLGPVISGLWTKLLANPVLGKTDFVSKISKLTNWVGSTLNRWGAAISSNFDTSTPFINIAVSVAKFGLDLALQTAKYFVITALIKLLLIALICLFASIKLFITIITTYFKIFINVVLGPLQIMVGSLPGNSGMISNWFKSVAANVLTFVGIVFVVNFFNYIATMVDPSQFNFFGNSGVIWPNWLIPLKGVIVIAGYFFASSLPGVINGMLGVGQSKEMSAAGLDIKKAASKIPLIGGLFNS